MKNHIFKLLADQNPNLKSILNTSNFDLGKPKSIVPSKSNGYKNTKITLIAKPSYSGEGSAVFYYDRVNLAEYIKDNALVKRFKIPTYEIQTPSTASITFPSTGAINLLKSIYPLGVFSSDDNVKGLDFKLPATLTHCNLISIKAEESSLMFTPNSEIRLFPTVGSTDYMYYYESDKMYGKAVFYSGFTGQLKTNSNYIAGSQDSHSSGEVGDYFPPFKSYTVLNYGVDTLELLSEPANVTALLNLEDDMIDAINAKLDKSNLARLRKKSEYARIKDWNNVDLSKNITVADITDKNNFNGLPAKKGYALKAVCFANFIVDNNGKAHNTSTNIHCMFNDPNMHQFAGRYTAFRDNLIFPFYQKL